MHPQTIPRHFNTFLVHFEQEAGSEGPEQGEAEMIESKCIILSVNENGKLTVNVTTSSTMTGL